MAEANTMDVIFVDYLLPGEQEETTPHHVTIKEFLALPQDQLTEQNKKIQKALGQLYELNDREPPLYHSFPKREAGPLVIDCTPCPQFFTASYNQDGNNIVIEESALELTELSLLGVFAHELKHAEQTSEEHYSLQRKMEKKDGLAYHQLRYLKEAQAFAFQNYVEYLACLNSSDSDSMLDVGSSLPGVVLPIIEESLLILESHTKDNSVDNFSDIQCEMIKKILPVLYYTEYRDNYNDIKPISNKDKGLTEEELPASFCFRQPGVALSLLKDMPREAMTPTEKISFEVRIGSRDIEDYIIDYNYISPDELLNIIKTEFTRSPEDGFERRIQRNKDLLKFFLSFRMDGKPLMQEKDILDLLDGARASGRKDVEEAIQEYQKECLTMTPQDKYTQSIADRIHRFIEDYDNMFFLGFRTVSDSDMSNAMAIEFTRPIENCSEKYIKNSKQALQDMLYQQYSDHRDVDISKLLEGARASGRKDVEEAMWEHHKEYPSDKRFSEEMFDHNPKDKVAEFMKHQEMEQAKVKAAVENASKRGATVINAAVTEKIGR